jgi:hypothetical protein
VKILHEGPCALGFQDWTPLWLCRENRGPRSDRDLWRGMDPLEFQLPNSKYHVNYLLPRSPARWIQQI